jgi:hypothetical protein
VELCDPDCYEDSHRETQRRRREPQSYRSRRSIRYIREAIAALPI